MASGVHGVRAHIGALREKIEVNLVTSISERRFLPIDKSQEIFTLPTVKDALQELNCKPEDRINLANTIYENGTALFAMLIDIWHEDLIVNFRKHGVLDNKLPLDKAQAQEIVEPVIADRLVSEVQWKFLPFVFPKRMWECQLHIADPMILPFVSCEQIGFGAFGDVEKIGISPSQQNFSDEREAEVYLVRKRLKAGGCEDDFEREDKCLRLLNGLKHPNIVPFWGSYTHKKEHYFLFPCIETDLGKFLISESRHGEFRWDFTFYAALTGLASALAKTHRLVLKEEEHGIQVETIGYHHDLRPPNVLVSHDSFILADFGLGSLKDAESLSHTPYKPISGDYIAPECTDMEEIPQTVNRAIDVWAFGCLILEVVTYMLRGLDGIKSFRRKRLTPGRLPQWKDSGFYKPQAQGGIKQEVMDWIEELTRHTTATSTETHLLKLGLDALQADPGKRPTMDQMHWRLAGASMLKHFESVEDILQKARGAEGPGTSKKHHHLESLRLAQERFEIWGRVLSLREIGICSRYEELPGEPIKVVTSLFHLFREEPEKRASGDPTSLRTFQDNMDRSIKELWDLLPSDLVILANDLLHQDASYHDRAQVLSSSSHTLHDETVTSGNTLLREFKDMAESFKDELSESISLDELLRTKSIDDVYDIIDDLQHRQELRDLSKMKQCLERLRGYTQIMDDTINGTSEYAAFIWGPLGFLLCRSRTFDAAYIAFINATAKIGGALPDFHAPDALLRHNTHTKEILVLLFKDVLDFYSVMLRPFSQPGWMFIFERSWPNLWELIKEVSSHISRLTRLMRTEISLENIHQEHEFRKTALEQFMKQASETRRQDFERIRTSLKPREYNESLYELRAERSSGTGTWLFSSKAFIEWFDDSHVESRVLWLKGIPGAGKTVLASTVVDHLKSVRRLTCFAFLTYKDEKISALTIMHSLIFQLAERDDERLDLVCESMGEELKSNLNAATDLLKCLILHAGSVFLVVDGVDEIRKSERGRMVTELLGLVKSCDGLRVIFSSRPEADLARTLGDTTVAIQVHDHNEQNIECYVKESMQKMFNDREILRRNHDEIKKLLAPIARRAKGMFLYARLIMSMAANMYDLSEIRNELAVLPEDLDDAYHRIISRLEKHSNKIQAKRAKSLLGWIACSPIPLTVEEAQQALAIKRQSPEQTYSMFAKLDPVELVGPIVETAGGYIRFVHFTAKEYVCSAHLGAPMIDMNRATLDLAIRCIDYLCQNHHDPLLSDQEVSSNVLTGQYCFDGFASQMWFELSHQYLCSVKALEVSTALVESIKGLWKSRKSTALQKVIDDFSNEGHRGDNGNDSEDGVGDEWMPEEVKQQHPSLHNLLRRVYQFRRSSFIYTGEADLDNQVYEHDPLSISDTSKRIRRRLDKKLCKEPNSRCKFEDRKVHGNCADILHYYGKRPFKCKFPRCEFWRQGFGERNRRTQHERTHEKPLKCPVTGCKFERIGFLSEKMRQKHFQEGHSSDPPQPKFDASDLNDDSVGPLLHYLVAENRVEEVRSVLSALSNPEAYKTLRLRELASFAASPAMLQLLGEYDYQPGLIGCIIQSIQGYNEMTMAYNLTGLLQPIDPGSRDLDWDPLCQLMSRGWVEGLKLWCEACRQQLKAGQSRLGKFESSVVVRRRLSDPRILEEAVKHPAGEEAVLFLWNESGLLSWIDDIPDWASRTLRHVARLGFSVTLATELLGKGARINFQSKREERTALHCAARNNSAEGAEMIRFLLLKGADPEATLEITNYRSLTGMKRIRDEKGAQNIHRWLGKSWDELVEETRHIHNEGQVGESLESIKTD